MMNDERSQKLISSVLRVIGLGTVVQIVILNGVLLSCDQHFQPCQGE